MTSYSPRAARALGFLKRQYNDIEVYVEDSSGHNMWLKVLKRILPLGVLITSVNVLNGRNSVVEACRLDQARDGRRRLYIIDADFDHVLGRAKSRLRHLYRLAAYCIENVLLHPRSVVELGTEGHLQCSYDEAIENLDLDALIFSHDLLLRKLFVVYAAAEDVESNVPTVSFSVHRLMTRGADGRERLDPEKVWLRIREVQKAAILVVGARRFAASRRAAWQRAKTLPLNKVVSGKDYLFPIIAKRLKFGCGLSGSDEQLKIQLAKEFSRDLEPGLHRRVAELVG